MQFLSSNNFPNFLGDKTTSNFSWLIINNSNQFAFSKHLNVTCLHSALRRKICSRSSHLRHGHALTTMLFARQQQFLFDFMKMIDAMLQYMYFVYVRVHILYKC